MKKNTKLRNTLIFIAMPFFCYFLAWAMMCGGIYYKTTKVLKYQGYEKRDIQSVKPQWDILYNEPNCEIVFADEPQHTYNYVYMFSGKIDGVEFPGFISVYDENGMIYPPDVYTDPTIKHLCGDYPFDVNTNKKL